MPTFYELNAEERAVIEGFRLGRGVATPVVEPIHPHPLEALLDPNEDIIDVAFDAFWAVDCPTSAAALRAVIVAAARKAMELAGQK